MKIFYVFSALISMFFATSAKAGDFVQKWWSKVENDAADVWQNGRYSLYIPVNTWHNRLAYDEKKIKRYNESPWGAGVGKYAYDEEGNWSALYAMVFKDSNYHPETMFGYAYQHNWSFGENKDWRIGAGYTIGLTQREEYAYVPLPLPLPIFGFGYKYFNAQAAYVPGVKNDGNVLLSWIRVDF